MSFKKLYAASRMGWRNKTVFSIFFNIVSLDINAHGPKMRKNYNRIMEEVDYIVVSKMAI